MASYSKSGKRWRVAVAVQGVRDTKTFSTKEEATAWAAERESEIRSGATQHPGAKKTLNDAFDRYLKEVSVHKRGHRMERHRLAAIAGHVVAWRRLGDMLLADITSNVIGQWRDLRLWGTVAARFEDKITGASVIREVNLLSHVFTSARREWG